ncbi:BGTF surface domain-containing protein, partial [Natrinema sp. LN54]|uniref:BGTF surface domain-containing protein n=1 Tax=Natrinema sp. LN54 TaxID=3458705 RepID=UPI0040372EA3
ATHTAPGGDSMSSLEDFEDTTVTESNVVAEEDHFLVTLDDYGATGMLADSGDDAPVGELLAENGVYLEMEQQDVPANSPDRVWNNSVLTGDYGSSSDAGDEYALDFKVVNGDDYEGDQLILKVPYEQFGSLDDADYGADASDFQTRALEADSSYDWTLKFSDDSVFVDEDEGTEVEGEFTLEEREISIDDRHEQLPNSANATVGGDTNVAPGTEVTVRAVSSGNFVLDPDTEVTADRTYSANFDFSGHEAGTEVELTATEDGGESDELDAELVDAGDAIVDVDASAPEEVTVDEKAALGVTISNDGEAPSVEDYTVTIDGEVVDEQELEVASGDSFEESYDFNTSATADIDWEVTYGDTTESGTLSVVEDSGSDDSGNESDSGSDSSGDSGSDDSGSDDSGSDDGEDDGTPGFGVGVALVALLGAAMLALRRQN